VPKVFELTKISVDNNVKQTIVHQNVGDNFKMHTIEWSITNCYLERLVWTPLTIVKCDTNPRRFKGEQGLQSANNSA
jgi:hypothetical protein